jgi:hypothetical protein
VTTPLIWGVYVSVKKPMRILRDTLPRAGGAMARKGDVSARRSHAPARASARGRTQWRMLL